MRFDSLFKLFEMENCLTEEGNILESLKKAPSPDYERIDLKMKSEKARSLEWMQSMLIDNKHEQEELVEEIYAIGKPVIVVLVTGKPFSISWIKEHIPAIVVQWYGGE